MEKKDIAARASEFAARKESIDRDAVARQQIKDFLARYPYREKPEMLRTMTPDDLFDPNASDRFFDWLDKRTNNVGVIRTNEGAVYPEAVKRIDFFKVVLTVLVSDKPNVSFKIDQNWGIIPGFGGDKLIAKKILSLYYSDKIVPIFRTEDLERFSASLGIDFAAKAKKQFRKDYASLSVGQKFELLNSGLLEYKAANLAGWSNTQFSLFLYQESLPAGKAMTPPPVEEPKESATMVSQKELAKTIQLYEARLRLAEKTIRELRNEASVKEARPNQMEEELRAKEEDMGKREKSLAQWELTLKEEARRVEAARKAESTEQADLRKTLEEMARRLREKEDEAQEASKLAMDEQARLRKTIDELRLQLRDKDERLQTLESEMSRNSNFIRIGESDFMEGDVGVFETTKPGEAGQEKVKTGTPRLDDLLNGGMPIGSQVVVYGPAFIGKEIAMDVMAANSISNGIPVVWVTTDKTIEEIREEMSAVIDGFERFEKQGLVQYVDAYSRIVGDSSVVENASYLEDSADVESISTMVDDRLAKVKDVVKEKGYRLVFRSVSSLSANHDIRSIFALLRQFVARRRKDKCVATYSIEKGIMSEQDLQIISSIMDGVIEFTTDGKSNFLTIQGICETQTRDKVQYTASKGSLNIGSFFLGRIK